MSDLKQQLRAWGAWCVERRELIQTQPGSILYDPMGWQIPPDPEKSPAGTLTPCERQTVKLHQHGHSNPAASRIDALVGMMIRAGDDQANAAAVIVCKWADGIMRSERDVADRLRISRAKARELETLAEGILTGALNYRLTG